MIVLYPQSMLRWRVKDILDQHGQTVYVLAQNLQGMVNRNTLYQISQNKTKRADLDTLEALAECLSAMTGAHIGIGDLFETVPDTSTPKVQGPEEA